MKYLRWLLFPFSLLYGLVVIIRNWCYDAGAFKSYKFQKPIISVGNLEVGGAGKSPMTEYLIRLLKNDYKVATLSRGYGRNTKGYLLGEVTGVGSREPGVGSEEPVVGSLEPVVRSEESGTGEQASGIGSQILETKSSNSVPDTRYSILDTQTSLAQLIGDEPAQFKNKFPDITVAVCEKRVVGVDKLLPNHDLVLMDDAYQHRAVEPGLSILLFDYNKVNEPHLLLPAGNFREPFSGRWRAQIIVITKCPEKLSPDEQTEVAQKIQPLPYQHLFFTSIVYQHIEKLKGGQADVTIDQDTTVFLLTGIANANPLVKYLTNFTTTIIHHNYPDHHPFTLKNITKLAGEFAANPSQKKIIITTEKDAQRLEESWFKSAANGVIDLPAFMIPISVQFLNNSGAGFNQLITTYVREHTT